MKNYYQLLKDPSDESKALIRPEDSPEEIKKAIKKAMRFWDKRTSASGDAQQKAEEVMLLLTEAREVLTEAEAKKQYDEELQRAEREEKERLAAEAEERRQREEEKKQKLAAEAAAKQREAEERRKKEEEARKERERIREEAERKREEEARRIREQQLARQRKRRPWRGGVVSLILNLIFVILIAWPVLSLGHLLPKEASFEPMYLYGEYSYLIKTDEAKGQYRDFDTWQGSLSDPDKTHSWTISDVFSYKATNFYADKTLSAVMYEDGAMVYDGNYVRFMNYKPQTSEYIALDVEQKGYTIISGRFNEENRQVYVMTNGPSAVWQSGHGSQHWNEKYQWNQDYNSLSGTERYDYLFGILTEAEEKNGELGNYDFFTCLYSYGNGELLRYKEGTAWFAETGDGEIRLYKYEQGSGNTKTLTVKRSYEGHGLGYFTSNNSFYYVDQNQVMRLRLKKEDPEPECVSTGESKIGSINFIRHSNELNLLYTVPEAGKWVLDVVDSDHRETHDLQFRDSILFASSTRLFIYKDMEIPKWAASFEDMYRKVAVMSDVYGIEGTASKTVLKILKIDFEQSYECNSFVMKD